MSILAGNLIYAGAIDTIIHLYMQSGRGNVGWIDAWIIFRRNNPGITQQTMEAVFFRAKESYELGRRYTPGGYNYTPAPSHFIDVRPLERSAGISGTLPDGGRRPVKYYHNVRVTIHSSEYEEMESIGRVFTFSSDSPLSRGELAERAEEKAKEFEGLFRDTLGQREQLGEISTTVQFVGGYRGY